MGYLNSTFKIGCLAVLFLAGTGSFASANEACMAQLSAAGKKAGYDADLSADEVSVTARTAAGLQPMWATMETCLNNAYASQRTGQGLGQKPYNYRQWYSLAGDTYSWCTTNVPSVDVVGGNGPQRTWYAIWVRCGHGAKMPKGMF